MIFVEIMHESIIDLNVQQYEGYESQKRGGRDVQQVLSRSLNRAPHFYPENQGSAS